MGLSFFVGDGVDQVEAEVSWGDYTQLDEDVTRELRDAERARRRGQDAPDPPDDSEDELRYRYWQRQRTFARVVPVPLDRPNHDVPVPGGTGAYLRCVVRQAHVEGPHASTRAVSLFLVNGRDPVEGDRADEQTLFHARLEVRCARGFAPRRRVTRSVHADDRRNDLQFRHHSEWAVGHGVATLAEPDGGACRAIRTTWLPRASVYRMKATHVAGALVEMDALATVADGAALHAGMAPLLGAYRDWIQRQRGKLAGLSSPRQETAGALLAEAELALGRMERGISMLGDDTDAMEAFRIANAAMAEAARRARLDEPRPRWRLFQLAFVLLNIAGATQPEHPDRQRVDLLFFPTGGGKTEAYLGVAAFILALRRIRGRGRPDGGAGVAVLLRYTLRLLTLDQLRRAAQLICALELQRRARPELLGSFRFSIGLWVGRSGSANRLADVVKALRQLRNQGRVSGGPPPIPLASCPWCETALHPDALTVVPDQRHPRALVVGCPNLACAFGFTGEGPAHQDGLPIVVVDDQVYRELPSIVVGTVDKFASLPWRGAVGTLFGRVLAEGEYGYYGEHERPPADARPIPQGLRPPELIIQDELHLISGPLGTMVGLYETAIDALCRDRVGYGPKVVASTATARRASEQIRAVFAREPTHLFPPQGLDDGDTFFADLDRTPEKSRMYVGVAAPGRSAKVVAARTYTALLGAAQRHWEQAGPPGPDNVGDTYMTLACYFNALKELGGAQRLVQEDVAQRTERLDLRRPVDQEGSAHFARRNVSYEVLELTSRQSTDDIARAIDLLSKPYGTTRTRTDVLLASSMISVGVDIGRLGLMVVNGQPKTTAEYIQASSRVGRETPGLVVTTLNLYKPRDRSHYERFQAYHDSFYREVEASSVTPFSARAVDRGLAGLIVGLARHLGDRMTPSQAVERIRRPESDALEERIIELLTARALAHRDAVSPALADSLRARVQSVVKDWKLLVEAFQQDAKPLKYSPWEKPKNYGALLSTAVDEPAGEHAELLAHFQAPTSMRDVEPSVHVWVDLPQPTGDRR